MWICIQRPPKKLNHGHGCRLDIRRTESEPASLETIPRRDAPLKNAEHIGEQLRVPDGKKPQRDGKRLDPLPSPLRERSLSRSVVMKPISRVSGL